MKNLKSIALLAVAVVFSISTYAQKNNAYKLIAYYSGDSTSLHNYDFKKITHLIYGFCHVIDGNLIIGNKKDTATLLAFQKIKAQNPKIKTMIALGGWGGCEYCSQTFNDAQLTEKFASSTKYFLQKYQLDGIDLDWEYPAVQGPPGHQFLPEDRANFTRLVATLRKYLGSKKLISFAAGGLQVHLEKCFEWPKINKYVDFVNVMTYDLVHGYSTITGHHTNLYSTYPAEPSSDLAMQFFKKIKFPLKKVMMGAGFYSREFDSVQNVNNGLYQPTKFLAFIDYKIAVNKHTPENGFVSFWDDKAKAPYWYNAEKKIFVTGENKTSVKLKCDYVKKNKLGGLMFWELFTDTTKNGLYDAIKL